MSSNTPFLNRLALVVAALGAATHAGAAVAAPFMYPDPVTPYGEIVNTTYQVMIWLGIIILVVVETALIAAIVKFRKKPGDTRQPETWSHNTTLEIVWTVIPFIMLIIMMVPTFQGLSYLADIPKQPQLTLEVVGRQFFWEYRYPDQNVTFTSAMRTEATAKIEPGNPEWDKMALYLPVDTKMLVKITGADVIHSWWVPAFGFQQMTTPGNLVQVPLEVKKAGNYTGACAYLCGPYHGAMDIKIKAVDRPTFDAWLAAHKAPGAIDPIAKVGKIGMVAPGPKAHGAASGHGEEGATGVEGREPAHRASPATGATGATGTAVEHHHDETEGTGAKADPKALMAQGQGIFASKCAGCHQATGTGVPGVFPPLAGAEQVNGDPAELSKILINGKSGAIKVKGVDYNGAMPPFGSMSDDEIAAVATYIRGSFGNQSSPVFSDTVKANR